MAWAAWATIVVLAGWVEHASADGPQNQASGTAPPSAAPAFGGGVTGAVTLYDPAAGTLPASQGWLYLTKPVLTSAAHQRLADGLLMLDTMAALADSAGYFALAHPRMLVLDRTRGFQVRLVLRLDQERHGSAHRAGFSWLVLGNDRRGIELGFWAGEIWAQSGPDFRHAEAVLFDTTARLTLYELRVSSEKYALWAAGTKLLDGPLRSYAEHWHPVYRTPNVVFVGDDTQSAAARVELGAIEIRGGRKRAD